MIVFIRLFCAILLIGLVVFTAVVLRAGERPTGHSELFPAPTLGGKQFWSDELFFRGWRIQRNAMTGHYRLLDPKDRRHGWGTFKQCRAKLEEIKREKHLKPMDGRAVIVLHGLIRSRKSMASLCKYLEKHGGYTVIDVSYPSTRRPMAEHAQSLARLIENLDGIDEISFVGHSMGNIVVRRYLHDQIDKKTGQLREKRIKRMVMLAPPNQGSQLATALANNGAYSAINGKPGQELGAKWKELEKKLAVPPFEFGIVAGGRGNDRGYNPALPGDDDGTVRVESTHLKGEADFVLVPVLHSFIMNDGRVHESTLRFLKKGHFRPKKVTRERPLRMIHK
jgi:pimeloyl-ACP methyl ester carboxylesterase